MNRVAIIVAAVSLWPGMAAAQFTPGLGRELPCYGGRNPGGAYVCACDQGFISGSAALILGGSNQMWGPGPLAQCLAWADGMAGAGSSPPPGQPGTPPVTVDPPKVTPPPNLGRKPTPRVPPVQSIRPIPEHDQCDAGFNRCIAGGTGTAGCVAQFNSCADATFQQNYNAAVSAGHVWP